MLTVAVEDLITGVIEVFLGSLNDLGYDGDLQKEEIIRWYSALTDEERFNVSSQLTDIIDQDREKMRECLDEQTTSNAS